MPVSRRSTFKVLLVTAVVCAMATLSVPAGAEARGESDTTVTADGFGERRTVEEVIKGVLHRWRSKRKNARTPGPEGRDAKSPSGAEGAEDGAESVDEGATDPQQWPDARLA